MPGNRPRSRIALDPAVQVSGVVRALGIHRPTGRLLQARFPAAKRGDKSFNCPSDLAACISVSNWTAHRLTFPSGNDDMRPVTSATRAP